jgi:hypothetical protein
MVFHPVGLQMWIDTSAPFYAGRFSLELKLLSPFPSGFGFTG